MLKLYENIQLRRKELGLSQDELAKLTGYTDRSSISKIESGKVDIPQSKIVLFADALKTTPRALLGEVEQSAPAPSVVKPHAEQKPSNGRRIIPLVGNIACGLPILAEENIESMIELPDGSKQCDFALRCRGDSMIEIGICDGDIAYIRKQPQVENGEIAAVRIGDEATLKKVYFDGDQIALYAANRDLFPLPQTYSGEQLADVHIEGKLVGYTHWD